MRERVFVAQPIPEVALDVLREAAHVTVYPYMDRQISVDELVANVRHADWLFALHETNVTADVINANAKLKGVGVMCAANPLVDMQAATARKLPVIVENREEVFPGVAPTTADLTMAMLLSLAYRLQEADRYTKAGKFRQEQTLAMMGVGCPGKTVGLIGMGRVATYMVPRIRAFDMQAIYTKRTRLAPEREKELGVEWVAGLDALLQRSDYVCVACAYNESTHKLIGRRELGLMKREAFLINTARGRIVDEPELIKALQEKRIAGAGLDVFWNEPPESHDPHVPEELCKLDNVILAPHNGGATWDVRGRKATSVAKGLVQLMRGERPASLLNPEIYK